MDLSIITDLEAERDALRSEKDGLERGILAMGAANDELRAEVERYKSGMRCPRCDELRLELGTVRADLAAAVEVLNTIATYPYAIYGADEIRISNDIIKISRAFLARMEVRP